MRYEEFRDRLLDVLREVGLLSFARPSETIDLSGSERRFRVFIGPSPKPGGEPFGVSGRINFRWGPFDAARSATCEEDLLTELYDRSEHPKDTAPRLVRVDLRLYARLPYGSKTRMPAPEEWASWSDGVEATLDDWLPRVETDEERRLLPAYVGGRSDLQVGSRITEDGTLSFDGISVLAYRLIQIPRVWDDPDKRDKEDDGSEALEDLAQCFKGALEAWKEVVVELGRWIKYGPPAEVEDDPFAGMDEDEDPEVTH